MTDEGWTDERIRAALQAEYSSPPFPADAVEARIETTLRGRSRRWLAGHPTARAVLAAAAALIVFVAGAEYGRWTAAPDRGDGEARPVTPLSIQRAGTEYVARLARLSSEAEGVTPAEREEARQVALAILYAATLELLADSEDDELLEAAAQLIYSRRQAESSPKHKGTLWF